MSRKDAILEDLKRVASELGHAPTRDEYRANGRFPERAARDAFGGYTMALTAAGLEPTKSARRSRLNVKQLFKADIEESVATLRESASRQMAPKVIDESRRILVIGDTHFPFVSVDALTAVYSYAECLQPTDIVQIGDLYDQLAASRFPKSQNYYSPDQESDLARKGSVAMWETLKRISPDARCVQILGNHDIRPMKAILESSAGWAERAVRKEFEALYTFDGVTTVLDSRQEYRIDDIVFQHGHYSKLGAHAAHNGMCTVVGHSHKGGVAFLQSMAKERHLWELNAGYVGDPLTKALGYGPQRFQHWTLGCGSIDLFGPRFVAF